MPEWNSDAVRHALEIARSRGYTEVELSAGGTSFLGSLSASSFAAPQAAISGAISTEESSGPATAEIGATLVGYYQPAPTPLAVGQKVSKGDVIAVITALGLANDVESTLDGEVTQVLVQPGDSVEYGQALAEVRVEV